METERDPLERPKEIGTDSSGVFVKEFFGWGQFQRQTGGALGLTPTPYQSRGVDRDPGMFCL